jgi:hypothetical protein
MGRPLNKKYFGNRNIGTGGDQTIGTLSNSQNYADDRIGGGFLASISNGTVGAIQINDTYKFFPTLNVAAPTLPDGVTAALAVSWEIATIVISDDGSGYTINQTGASATLTGLSVQADIAPVVTINTDGSGNVSAISVAGGRGTFTDVDGTGIVTWGIAGAGGSNAQATVTFRVKSIAVTQQGSGYVGTPSLSWSAVNGGTMPSAQSVTMGTDSGIVGTAGNQENAIRMTAFLPSGSAGEVDIIRQVSTNRYKVTDGTRTGIVQLQTTLANAAGEGSIAATDSAGGQYFVTKLTGRKATVTQAGGSGWLYATGQAAPWKFDAPAGIYLQIANA